MAALPDSDILGLGFDILGEYSVRSTKLAVVSLGSPSGNTLQYGGNTYNVPSGIRVFQGSGNPSLSGKAQVYESKRELQSHFAAKAGVKGSYGSFSGSLEALYGSDSSLEESAWYGLLEARLTDFTMVLANPTLSPDFLADPEVKAMLATPTFDRSKPGVFFRVFNKFGTHVVTHADVGASIDYAATVNRSAGTDKQSVEAKLDLEYKAVITDVAANASADWSTLGKTWASSRKVSLAVTGGDETLMMSALDPSFGENYSQAYASWLKTINSNPKMIDFRLTRMSDLPGFSPQVAAALGQAIDAYTNYGIYVEATRDTNGTCSGLIEVSGKQVDQSFYSPASAPRGHQGIQSPASIMQLVVVDARSLTPVFNRTAWPFAMKEAWTTMFSDIDALATSNYFCAFFVANWYAGDYPTPPAENWLKRCGASLDAWRNLIDTRTDVTYAFIGASNSRAGIDPRLEQLDCIVGKTSAFASAIMPLIPGVGGFTLLDRAAAL